MYHSFTNYIITVHKVLIVIFHGISNHKGSKGFFLILLNEI